MFKRQESKRASVKQPQARAIGRMCKQQAAAYVHAAGSRIAVRWPCHVRGAEEDVDGSRPLNFICAAAGFEMVPGHILTH